VVGAGDSLNQYGISQTIPRYDADMRNAQLPPMLIGIGLVTLLTASHWPTAPVVTAMAIIALGSTDVLIARFRKSVAALQILVLHGMTYVLLYSLFIGARLHVPTTAPMPVVNNLTMLDLAISAFPMTVALSRIFNCLRPRGLSRR
jgi:hypothetical protein